MHSGRSIVEVVERLQSNTSESTFEIVLRRSHVLEDALRKMERIVFDPRKKLSVSYAQLSYLFCLSNIGGVCR